MIILAWKNLKRFIFQLYNTLSGTADSTYNMSQVAEDVLRIQEIDFCCKENAKTHKTFDYELVKDIEKPNPVFRRGENFFMDIVRTILCLSYFKTLCYIGIDYNHNSCIDHDYFLYIIQIYKVFNYLPCIVRLSKIVHSNIAEIMST